MDHPHLPVTHHLGKSSGSALAAVRPCLFLFLMSFPSVATILHVNLSLAHLTHEGYHSTALVSRQNEEEHPLDLERRGLSCKHQNYRTMTHLRSLCNAHNPK